MSFWDDLEKNAGKAVKFGAKQGSRLLESGKLKLEQSAAEIELKELYEKIGEAVVGERIRDITQSPHIAGLLEQVKIQEQKIKKIEAAIKASRRKEGELGCEHCGKKISSGTRYCPHCAHPQAVTIK